MNKNTLRALAVIILFVASGISPFEDRSAKSRRLIMEEIDKMKDLGKYEIEVEAQGGVARITGSVSSPDASRRIESVVRNTEGVDRVYNDLQIVPSEPKVVFQPPIKKAPPTDSEIEANVSKAISLSGIKDPESIEVEVRNGVAILKGHRDSFKDIDQILSSTLMVDGVREIKNEIALSQKKKETGWAPVY